MCSWLVSWCVCYLSLFGFELVRCKLTYSWLNFSLFQLLFHLSEHTWQLSSSVKMSGSFFWHLLAALSVLCNDTVIFLLSLLKDSLGGNCSISVRVWFLLSSLTASVKFGTECPVESYSAFVLGILLATPCLKCYSFRTRSTWQKTLYRANVFIFTDRVGFMLFYTWELPAKVSIIFDKNNNVYGKFWSCKPLHKLY